ncbi:hypothetical protein HCDG_08103 [Histoplasma capsulatum H143]|uniref:Uncharacterized protein n=1 Tax=Ajellomyces capsulatus (strain H143) TaxID=544712 RepID=C6HPH2_AJECH|nr:hypothetical protein HCDG_08103 [Histoplasma capsulatum H143]
MYFCLAYGPERKKALLLLKAYPSDLFHPGKDDGDAQEEMLRVTSGRSFDRALALPAPLLASSNIHSTDRVLREFKAKSPPNTERRPLRTVLLTATPYSSQGLSREQ